ncbi:RH5 [Bovine atadenovirus D]|uniref:RH5 n=1 Tax=Bovine adenovirus 4 TaxID=70333 RepID=Q997G7_ADEB4|nr:RH5 [Bovine atadenovirus D]AAK13188.2 RH5 [Bovine adenovirus 4]
MDLYTFQRLLKGNITCKCKFPCSIKCVKFALEFMCKSELTTNYISNTVSCHSSKMENAYCKAIMLHHSPSSNYCLSPFCLLTGKWKLAATHFEKKHFCLLKEDTLVSRETYPTAKCHLTVHNVLRGGCCCENPFSENCFAAFLTAFCKYFCKKKMNKVDFTLLCLSKVSFLLFYRQQVFLMMSLQVYGKKFLYTYQTWKLLLLFHAI